MTLARYVTQALTALRTETVFTAGHGASEHTHAAAAAAAAAEVEQLQSGQLPTLALEAIRFNIVIKEV